MYVYIYIYVMYMHILCRIMISQEYIPTLSPLMACFDPKNMCPRRHLRLALTSARHPMGRAGELWTRTVTCPMKK